MRGRQADDTHKIFTFRLLRKNRTIRDFIRTNRHFAVAVKRTYEAFNIYFAVRCNKFTHRVRIQHIRTDTDGVFLKIVFVAITLDHYIVTQHTTGFTHIQ